MVLIGKLICNATQIVVHLKSHDPNCLKLPTILIRNIESKQDILAHNKLAEHQKILNSAN